MRQTPPWLITLWLTLCCCVGLPVTASFGQTTTLPQPIFPKYKVLAVVYAPPGSSSSVTYGNTKFVGSTDTISTTSSSDSVSTTSFEAGATLGLFGGSIQYNQSDGWGTSIQSSNSIAVQTNTGNSVSTMGPISSALGVNHDNDVIYIWLNPVLSVASQSSTLFNWTNLSSNSCDRTDPADTLTFFQHINGCDSNQYPFPDVIGIPVWCLKNPYWPGQGCAQWLPYTQRSWDLSTWGSVTNPVNGKLMPVAPGLTLQDYADILQADPFVAVNGYAANVCHPTYGPNLDPNDSEFVDAPEFLVAGSIPRNYAGTPSSCAPPPAQEAEMTRFQAYGTVEYPEPGPNGLPTTYNGQFQYAQTQTQGLIATDTHTVSTSWDATASFGISFGIASFDAALSVGQQNSTTWQNQSNTQSIQGTTDSASYTITGPQLSDNYTGPPTFNVYLDNIYGTFAFYSPLEPPVTLGAIIATTGYSACPTVGAQFAPPTFTFAQELIGTASAPQTVYLENCSQYPLTMVGPAVTFTDSGFQLLESTGTDNCSNQLLAASANLSSPTYCTLQIVFDPVASDAPSPVYGSSQPVNATLIAAGTENISPYQNILVTGYASAAGSAANTSQVGGTLYPNPIQHTATTTDPFSQNVYEFPTPSDYVNWATPQQFIFTNLSSQYIGFGPPYNYGGYLLFSDLSNNFGWEGYNSSQYPDTCYAHTVAPNGTCSFYVSFRATTTAPQFGVWGSRITMMGSVGTGIDSTAIPMAIAGVAGTGQTILSMSPSPFSGSLTNPPATTYNIIPTPITITNNNAVNTVTITGGSATGPFIFMYAGTWQGYTATCGSTIAPTKSCTAYIEALPQSSGGTYTGTVTIAGQFGSSNVLQFSATDNVTYTQIGSDVAIRLTGTEQSKTVTTPAKPGKATLTVSGKVNASFSGTRHVVLTVGGFKAEAAYTDTATSQSVATALAAAANASASPVTATVSGDVINLKSKKTGTVGNLAYVIANSTDFAVTPQKSSLTGGADAVTTTEYDDGSVDAAVGSVRASSHWGKGSTPQTIAKQLASSLNTAGNGAFTASANGSAVMITPAANNSVPSVTVGVSDAKGFTPPSFAATTGN